MSNKSSPHQHGLHTTNITRPKSKARIRLNKEKARVRRTDRFAKLDAAYQSAVASL